jgi:hypothetical protein
MKAHEDVTNEATNNPFPIKVFDIEASNLPGNIISRLFKVVEHQTLGQSLASIEYPLRVWHGEGFGFGSIVTIDNGKFRMRKSPDGIAASFIIETADQRIREIELSKCTQIEKLVDPPGVHLNLSTHRLLAPMVSTGAFFIDAIPFLGAVALVTGVTATALLEARCRIGIRWREDDDGGEGWCTADIHETGWLFLRSLLPDAQPPQ